MMRQEMAVFIMSKIQIESNSQLCLQIPRTECRCIYHVKDTNRKQFTTSLYSHINLLRLYLSCQRYKSKAIHNKPVIFVFFGNAVFIMSKIQIESNSQQGCRYPERGKKLYLSCQRYKSKAIHNISDRCTVPSGAVFIMSKIQIESNSQLSFLRLNCVVKLYLSCQRYKSKAIHNGKGCISTIKRAVFIMSKIQIESNSQRKSCMEIRCSSCIYHVKDTNRKQFTTGFTVVHVNKTLYLSCQRYKSKAIHNVPFVDIKITPAVFIMSKIQIESNSQPNLMD